MYIRFDYYKERILYNKIVAALTEYESNEVYKEDSFYTEYFYGLLCEIQNVIDHAEKDGF